MFCNRLYDERARFSSFSDRVKAALGGMLIDFGEE